MRLILFAFFTSIISLPCYSYQPLKSFQYPKRPRLEAYLRQNQLIESDFVAALPVDIFSLKMDIGFTLSIRMKTTIAIRIGKMRHHAEDRLFDNDGLLLVEEGRPVVGLCNYEVAINHSRESNKAFGIFRLSVGQKKESNHSLVLKREGAAVMFELGEDGKEAFRLCEERWYQNESENMKKEAKAVMQNYLSYRAIGPAAKILLHLRRHRTNTVFKFHGHSFLLKTRIDDDSDGVVTIQHEFYPQGLLNRKTNFKVTATFIDDILEEWNTNHKPKTSFQKMAYRLSSEAIKAMAREKAGQITELPEPHDDPCLLTEEGELLECMNQHWY